MTVRIFTYLVYFIMILNIIFSCDTKNKASNQAQSVATIDSVTFESFLVHFFKFSSFNEWPKRTLIPLVQGDGQIYKKEVDLLLRTTFAGQINTPFYSYISTRKLKQLEELPNQYSVETKAPLTKFKFYAFEKVKKEKFWLVSIFAYKTNGTENEEYCAHPFILITYTLNGQRIDDFIWWKIVNDMQQFWTDVAVKGDTLITGQKTNIFDTKLSNVRHKIIITEDGKFKQVDMK